MNTFTTAIIVAVITGLLSNLPWLIKVSTKLYKDKESKIVKRKRIIFAILRYIFIIASTLGIYFSLTLSKFFILSIASIVILCSYFIATDVLYFTISGAAKLTTKDQLIQERELWFDQLAMCDPKDKERIEMIKSKIDTVRKKLNSI